MYEIFGRRCLIYSFVGNINSEVEIESNGYVFFFEVMESIILCMFNVKNFFFDIQICIFMFFVLIKKFYFLDIMFNKFSFDLCYFIGNEEWDLIFINV